MLYLNLEIKYVYMKKLNNLTLTSVVFESRELIRNTQEITNLTLTSVVFECWRNR